MAQDHEAHYHRSEKSLRKLRALARLLDSSIPLPGGLRIGLDGLIGLIPGFGDAVGASLSGYIIWRAAQIGASWPTLLRMTANTLVDGLVGLIPILGDLFDFAWKANERNMALLEASLQKPPASGSAKHRLRIVAWILIALLVGLVLLSLYLFVKLLMLIFGGAA